MKTRISTVVLTALVALLVASGASAKRMHSYSVAKQAAQHSIQKLGAQKLGAQKFSVQKYSVRKYAVAQKAAKKSVEQRAARRMARLV